MTKIRGVLLILLVMITGSAYAQVVYVTGKIINKDNSTPVEGANVTVLQGTSTSYHTVTDSAGNFKIPLSYYQQMTAFKITNINYQELEVSKKTDLEKLKNDHYNIGKIPIKSTKIELKEVNVKSQRRYSDTTNFNLADKKFERSVMVDDLFSGTYGFSRDKSGHLYYKGTLVSDVLVDGGDFFGKNNLDVYHLLPALTMENIQVIKTNIDSTTNITLLRPTIKVNLTLKAKYQKGAFGNANLGGGTGQRYLGNTDLFAYKKKEQISIDLNANNINAGENLIFPPSVSFSSNGNNINAHSGKVTYHNFLGKKVEVNFSAKGKYDDKQFTSTSQRNDFDIPQFSKTVNTSKTKIYGLDNEDFNINYRINPLNSINISQTASSIHTKQNDSLNYRITQDSANTESKAARIAQSLTNTLSGKVLYLHRFASKKGRLISISASYNDNTYHITENDNIFSLKNNQATNYFIDGTRMVTNHQFLVNSSYTEPLGENAYVALFVNYKKDNIAENDQVKSDTSINYLTPGNIYNQYIEPGARFQKTFSKAALSGDITGIFDSKTIGGQQAARSNLFNLNFDLRADYKADTRTTWLLDYSLVTSYPDINQLTSLNSTFDLVTQTSGNVNLKPQNRYSAKASYNFKKSDTEILDFGAEFNYYTSKFGYQLVSSGPLTNMVSANVGDAKSGTLTFTFVKTFANQQAVTASSTLSYQEEPSYIGFNRVLNNGVIFNQTISTSIPIIKSVLTLSPLLSAGYSKYYYSGSASNIVTLTYSDRVSLTIFKSQIAFFPLVNYSHNIGNNSSFSMNGEFKRSFFKDYMNVWVQAYDIFNSFKFFNNYAGPTFTQSTSYSNTRRYIFVGASFKFNNLK